MTSRIFRCHGLQSTSEQSDQIGCHDLAYWLIFVAILCAWFVLLFAPQRERLANLAERQNVLCAHLKAEKRELQRLDRSINDLTNGDPQAWERAARGRLGWLQPGEVTDVVAWNQTHNIKPPALPSDMNRLPNIVKPPLQAPRVPMLPVPPPTLSPARAVASGKINPELIGLTRGEPPPLPPRIHVVAQHQPAHAPTTLVAISHAVREVR
jgi:hypothetical protein